MAYNFPNAPTMGEVFTPAPGVAWQWNGFAWQGMANALAIVTSDLPPEVAMANQLWYESDSGNFFIRYDDGNSLQWVQINGNPSIAKVPTLALVTVADAPPSNPMPGQTWYETDSGKLWIWLEDANSAQWVQIGAD